MAEVEPASPREIHVDVWIIGEILWRRRWVIIGVFLAFVIIGVAVALKRPRMYKAVSVLRVSPGADIVPVIADYLGGSRQRPLATHAQMLKSPAVVEAALKRLGPEARATFPKAVWSQPITVLTPPGSDLMSIQVTASKPTHAAAFANALAETYVEIVEQSNQETALAITRSLEPELVAASKRYEEAQKQLSEVRKKTGVYDFQAEYERVFEDLSEVRRSSAESPVKNSIADVETELAAQQAALAEAERLLGRGEGDGPARRPSAAAAVQLEEAANSYRVAMAGSKAKLARLRQEEAKLEQRLNTLNALDAEMRALETDVQAKEQVYEALQTKAQQMVVNATTQLSMVQVVSSAELPLQPAGLSKRLLVLAAGMVGLLLGVGLAVLLEAAEQRRRGIIVRA